MPGKRIRQIRTAKDLSQENLATDLNISQALVSKYESDAVVPNVEMLHKIAASLEVFAFELIYSNDTQLKTDVEIWLNTKGLKTSPI